MPVRAVIAILATVVGVALMASFKTPDQTAVRTATAPRPPAPAATPDPNATTPGASPPSPTPAPGAQYRDGSYDGATMSNQYGDVRVRVIVSQGRITDVQALALPNDLERSAFISEQAGPLLHDEALQAQSAQIDILSGATYTSEGYAQSLQSALDKAHI